MTAQRPSPRRKDTELAFDALRVEGGLLAPEWLAKVSRLEAGNQAEADYGVPKGLNLRDEIGRYWRWAQSLHADFSASLAAKADPKRVAERFVTSLLRDVFGFTDLAAVAPMVIAERGYAIGFGAGTRVPVVVAPAGSGLDTLSMSFGEGGRRRSAFGLVQEYLNAAAEATWGVVTDGVTLRIARDNASLTRPAWIEADLGRIFAEGLFSDFASLWLLAHASRFGKGDRPGSECALEAWRESGREEGTRARQQLRRGVEDALAALGQGFLAHPGNAALRAAVESGELTERDLFNQLLRLVYRLIFLLTVEERGLLHPGSASDDARQLYADGYSLRRLRERSARRSAHDRHTDAWDSVRIACRGLAAGEPRLGLPALAGLFAAGQCPALDAAKLENRWLLLAVFKLAWLRGKGGLARVNWRDMGPEELGSVYESLLELVPLVSVTRRSFTFARASDGSENARHSTGSYYTPDSLVQVLLDSALEPVVRETIAGHPDDAVERLLSLSIVDPACGSGHFLLAAARRLAAHVARIQAEGTPSAAEYRRALRQVVGRCIFGVDLNPMAVELCRVALWMEAVEPGLPLNFLEAHIRVGNALLGTTNELMAGGIPDSAWEPLEGDDKQVARTLKKRNNREASGQTSLTSLWAKPALTGDDEVTRAMAELERTPDGDAAALAKKEALWRKLQESRAFRQARLVADAWCAAFVWPKLPGPGVEAAPTMEVWRQLRDGARAPAATTVQMVEALREEYQFLHWHLAFPGVFARGGFDVVLGNPPYLNQLETDTAVGRGVRRLLSEKFGEIKQPYTDIATLFMVVGVGALRPGGRQALVHPLALFAAQDAAPARRHLAERSSIASLWMTTEHIFASASVFVCAVCLVKEGPRSTEIQRRHSNRFVAAETVTIEMDSLAAEATWGELIADLIGVPRVRLAGTRRIRDIAGTTADFRDQFYGLAPHIVEDGPDTPENRYPPLIVTGLIDPAVCLWGDRGCKFAKTKWMRPRVDMASLTAAGLLTAWAKGRLTPKIVVATQTRVIEAFADPKGVMINTVPTITVTPRRAEDLWLLLAVLLSPPVSAWALGRYVGTALATGAIKMSADQVGQVPLPTVMLPWERAARLVEEASSERDGAAREAGLIAAGALMCDAYGTPREPVLSWWRERYASDAPDGAEDAA